MKREEKFSLLSEQEENRVDKDLVKNLLLGYFSAASHKKSEVLKLIASILEFSPAELEQVIYPYPCALHVTVCDWISPNHTYISVYFCMYLSISVYCMYLMVIPFTLGQRLKINL